jgi:hypothetical protein
MRSSLLYAALIGTCVILAGCRVSSAGSCSGIAPCTGANSATPTQTNNYAQNNGSNNGYATTRVNPQQQIVVQQAPQPIVISATGYAAPMVSKKLSRPQIRLLTLRGSKVDAYRNLSERVYGLKLRGSSSLRSMMTAHDELQTFVDAYLMGAKVVSQRELEDGSFETIVEMALQENFQQCVQNPGTISNNPACQMGYSNINSGVSQYQSQTSPQVRSTTTNFYSVE